MYLITVNCVGYVANTGMDGKPTRFVEPPVTRLVTTRFGLFAPLMTNDSVELVVLTAVIAFAVVPAELVTTSVPLVRVMMLFVLVAPQMMLLASTVPLRMLSRPRVESAAVPEVLTVRPSTRLELTRSVAEPLTLMMPTFGAVLVFGPRDWLPA